MPVFGANLLKRLRDVVITSPADGDVLAYNSLSQKWKNQAGGGGGGGGGLSVTEDNTLLVVFNTSQTVTTDGYYLSFTDDAGVASTWTNNALPESSVFVVDTTANTWAIKDSGLYAWSVQAYAHGVSASTFSSIVTWSIVGMSDIIGDLVSSGPQFNIDYASQGASDANFMANGTVYFDSTAHINPSSHFSLGASGDSVVVDGIVFRVWKLS